MHSSFLLSVFLLLTGILASPLPAPTGVPTTSAAKTELAALTVAAQGSQDGYSRDLFPHVCITSNLAAIFEQATFLSSF
jgi:hypothetical protein